MSATKKCKLCKLHIRHYPTCPYCETCCNVIGAPYEFEGKKRKRWIGKIVRKLRKLARKG